MKNANTLKTRANAALSITQLDKALWLSDKKLGTIYERLDELFAIYEPREPEAPDYITYRTGGGKRMLLTEEKIIAYYDGPTMLYVKPGAKEDRLQKLRDFNAKVGAIKKEIGITAQEETLRIFSEQHDILVEQLEQSTPETIAEYQIWIKDICAFSSDVSRTVFSLNSRIDMQAMLDISEAA